MHYFEGEKYGAINSILRTSLSFIFMAECLFIYAPVLKSLFMNSTTNKKIRLL